MIKGQGQQSLKHQYELQLFNYSLLIVMWSLKLTVLVYQYLY